MNVQIRHALSKDLANIVQIYNHYVEHDIATLALEPATLHEVTAQWQELQSQSIPWLVASGEERVLGFAHASFFKTRGGYQHTLETTVYIDPKTCGQGLGRRLYAELLAQPRLQNAHTLIGALSLPNPASVRLHESFGFRKVAHLTQVGKKFGRWIDVGYWQRHQTTS